MLRDEDIGLARVSFHDMTYFTFFFIYSKVPNNRGPTIIYFDQFSHPHVLIKHPHDYFFGKLD